MKIRQLSLFLENSPGKAAYDGCYVWATAAALAGGTGEPGNEAQNRKVSDRMRAIIWRGVTGVTRFIPNEQAAYTYPTQTKDPSLGMPHQFLQIQDYTKGGTGEREDPAHQLEHFVHFPC